MRAIGYHGTSADAAHRILHSGFQASRNAYDWLGDGAYFFQDAPVRAREWARGRFGAGGAVVAAEIDLQDCMDLLDVEWHTVLQESYADLVRRLAASTQSLPRQTSGAHRLDRDVINQTAGRLAARGSPIRSVRAAFPEGEPLYPGSALWSRSHVQIAVRDLGAILRMWRAA